MTALGIYFSQQKPKTSTAKDPKLVEAGAEASTAPATRPRACRRAPPATRPRAPASRRTIPRVSGQYADYTYAQLKAFKAGERGNDKDGKDAQGKIMAGVAASSPTRR